MHDIRWKQRFSNLEKAFCQLTEFIEKGELNKFELQGLIQCFEYTFELGWKVMKDYLENEGYILNTPRETIKTAFSANLVDDGALWIDALEKRNLMSHTYEESVALSVGESIKEKYYFMIKKLYLKLKEEI